MPDCDDTTLTRADYTVTFRPGDVVVPGVAGGETLLWAAAKADVFISSACAGASSCGKCVVQILSGEVKAEPTAKISSQDWERGVRLACVSRVVSDVVVRVPMERRLRLDGVRDGVTCGAASGAGRAERSERPAKKPEWLKKPLPESGALRRMETVLRGGRLHTVCESALCPNLGECFARGTATFLILGDVCTRDCGFCSVKSGSPVGLECDEPGNVAEAVARLGLHHVVVTSVTRDDLPDGGAGHYVATMRAIRSRVPEVTLEVLVPDFAGRMENLDLVLAEAPEVFNHNIETVPRLYPSVRPQASYERSLAVLRRAAGQERSLVKTGWMVGLGEEQHEVEALLAEVAEIGVDIVTIGQYLRPSRRHLAVFEYVRPEVFATYREFGEALGLQVHSAPFVRSSFQAGESFVQAKTCGGRKKE